MASPRTVRPAKVRARFFSGCPWNRCLKTSLHLASKPQLAERRGATATPFCARMSTQAPLDPRRGQLAPPGRERSPRGQPPPRHRRDGGTADGPIRPTPASPCGGGIRPPARAGRASQARSRGADFMATGKTRPLEPTKVGWPNPAAQSLRAAGGKASMAGARKARAVP